MGRVDVASLYQQTPFGTLLECCFSPLHLLHMGVFTKSVSREKSSAGSGPKQRLFGPATA